MNVDDIKKSIFANIIGLDKELKSSDSLQKGSIFLLTRLRSLQNGFTQLRDYKEGNAYPYASVAQHKIDKLQLIMQALQSGSFRKPSEFQDQLNFVFKDMRDHLGFMHRAQFFTDYSQFNKGLESIAHRPS